ncbi:MAG: DegT/DnrJ/EryC1/StrS family aminotransferase [Deltaproteobacteria bacterium]|nr:DegT/DnrJ/EryC1/StrS family aminotransferase [Deltaproteobacteria bacterium]
MTRSITPDLKEYNTYLERILASGYLTNNGACVNELEAKLSSVLNLPHLALCANGTLALQLALRVSGLSGKKIITTPFSYVATVSALLAEGCEPVFADIDEDALCLDPAAVENILDDQTGGILPVHIYGNVCDVDKLGGLAETAGLPLIYDASQCFGSEFRGRSVLAYGDCATCSFHATKVFHTAEGGCVACRSKTDLAALKLARACGHSGDTHIMPGLNAKMSELHAAMGLCLLERAADNIAGRRAASLMYDALLPAHTLRRPLLREGLTYNHAYYPVLFETEKILLRAVASLNAENVFPRRYFYPALNTLPYLPRHQPCPVAESAAKRALCLPLYAELPEADVERICAIVRRSL